MCTQPHTANPTPRPVPRPGPPPAPQCARFDAAGVRCTNRTTNPSGWCGKCAGFASSEKSGAERQERGPFTAGPDWVRASPPLDVDEIQDVRVTKRTISSYATIHGCGEREADAQIRILLEDLLLSGQCDRSLHSGLYRLMTREGYLLLVDGNGTIRNYYTLHNEREWCQVKAGVKSRSSTKRVAKRWMRDLVEDHDHQGVEIIVQVLKETARGVAREDVPALLQQMTNRLVEEVVPQLGPEGGDIVDSDGGQWIVRPARDSRHEWALIRYIKPGA